MTQKGERNMTKADLIDAIADKAGLSKKDAGVALEAALETIKKGVKKEQRMSLPDFGTFTVRKRKARTGRNPQTGKAIQIKASKTVGFKPAPAFKKSL
jgi:DNA-binding protein HU-beta